MVELAVLVKSRYLLIVTAKKCTGFTLAQFLRAPGEYSKNIFNVESRSFDQYFWENFKDQGLIQAFREESKSNRCKNNKCIDVKHKISEQ